MILSTPLPVAPEDLAVVAWRKSTRSQGGSGNCVEVGAVPWRKSSRSQGAGGNCVELGPVPEDRVAVRDSKDRDGAVFIFAGPQWTAFLDTVKTGTLDQH